MPFHWVTTVFLSTPSHLRYCGHGVLKIFKLQIIQLSGFIIMRSTRSNRTPSFSIPCRKHFWYLEQWNMQVFWHVWKIGANFGYFFEKVMDWWHPLAMLKGSQKRPQIVFWWTGQTFENDKYLHAWQAFLLRLLISHAFDTGQVYSMFPEAIVRNHPHINCYHHHLNLRASHLGWSSWRRPCKPRRRRPHSGTRRRRRRKRDNSASVVPLHPWSSGKDNHNDSEHVEKDDLDLWEAALRGGRA